MPLTAEQKELNRKARNRRRNERKKALMGRRSDRTKNREQLINDLLAANVSSALANKIKSPTIIGRGAYNFRKALTGKNAARKRNAILGRAVDIGGRSLGALNQAAAGDYLGAMMSGLKILGKGDYTLQRNTIVSDMTSNQVPVMHSAKESIRFRHREFVMDVVSPVNAVDFTTFTWQINPGLSGLFPFLSNIALNFQEYKFMGLAFEYKAMSGVAISTGTTMGMGTVGLAAQYRANAPTFLNKVEMMNQMWSVDGRPSDSFMLPIECDPAETPLDCLYVRGASVPDDVKFYDLAKVTLAMTGIPVPNSLIGELWITYDVELYKPQASGVLDLYAPFGLWSTIGASGDFTATRPFSTTPIYNNFDIRYLGNLVSSTSAPSNSFGFYHGDTTNSVNLTTTIVGSAGQTVPFSISSHALVLPFGLVGVYQLTFQWTGTAAATNFVAGADAYGNVAYGFGNAVSQNNWRIVRQFNGSTTGTNTIATINAIIRIVSPSAQAIVRLSQFNVIPTGAVTATMEITQVNGNVV